MTPVETLMALEAAAKRAEMEQQRLAWLAWHIAALQRTKRIPDLNRLLGGHRTVQLKGAELERRRREHAELVERMSRGRNRAR
jgi:hypothetical protein